MRNLPRPCAIGLERAAGLPPESSQSCARRPRDRRNRPRLRAAQPSPAVPPPRAAWARCYLLPHPAAGTDQSALSRPWPISWLRLSRDRPPALWLLRDRGQAHTVGGPVTVHRYSPKATTHTPTTKAPRARPPAGTEAAATDIQAAEHAPPRPTLHHGHNRSTPPWLWQPSPAPPTAQARTSRACCESGGSGCCG